MVRARRPERQYGMMPVRQTMMPVRQTGRSVDGGMFYRERDTEEDGSAGGGILDQAGLPRTLATWLSTLLGLGGIALLALRPALLGDRAFLIERVAQGALLVGILGALMHAFSLRPNRRLSGLAADPRICWPLLLAGAGYLLWVG